MPSTHMATYVASAIPSLAFSVYDDVHYYGGRAVFFPGSFAMAMAISFCYGYGYFLLLWLWLLLLHTPTMHRITPDSPLETPTCPT